MLDFLEDFCKVLDLFYSTIRYFIIKTLIKKVKK